MMDALMMMGGGFGGGGGQKLSKRVAFPERLNLSKFMSQRSKVRECLCACRVLVLCAFASCASSHLDALSVG